MKMGDDTRFGSGNAVVVCTGMMLKKGNSSGELSLILMHLCA